MPTDLVRARLIALHAAHDPSPRPRGLAALIARAISALLAYRQPHRVCWCDEYGHAREMTFARRADALWAIWRSHRLGSSYVYDLYYGQQHVARFAPCGY